jgi:translation initiation factor IF-2
MRQRGSDIADLAVLVIAADDGVAPQTRESLEFIKKSGIPFIVAINKIDLKTSDPNRVKTQLTEENVVVEEFGGQVPVVLISAKTGAGIPELLEMINLVYSLNPIESQADAPLTGFVLESRLNSQKGPLATVVIKTGTLKIGRELFQDQSIGKVKAMSDFDGHIITSAPPSLPVEILGLTSVPEVGSIISDHLLSSSTMKQFNHETTSSDSNVNIILRTDVAGSLEAIRSAIGSKVNLISAGTGEFTENDILLAATSKAEVLGFNLKISGQIAKLAETEKVHLRSFSIIYELFDYVDKLLLPEKAETVVGRAQILADLKFGSDRIAGCKCLEGLISRSANIRLERDHEVVGISRIKSLKIGKNDVSSVKAGTEFGAHLHPSIDFRVGDVIIATIG